ncbi:MAG: hypothetical protein JWO08_2489 [Verrucomicrobiaceae bacterium]|nr:hypothetical protein [Verrucomicrobiaceae bacterium]
MDSLPSSHHTVPISVAIPAFGNEAALGQTLRHIFNCEPLPQEVLLHLDGGWQPSHDFTSGAPVPVRLFHSAQNLGPGGGRHRLFHEAACDLIASFDDDSWPLDKDYFARALAVMEAFPNAALMSPAVYLQESPALRPQAEVMERVSFDGSASVTRRSHYLQLPGYVPVPNTYGVEEADLSLQAHAAGFQVLKCPWLRAWHQRAQADYLHSVLPWIKNEVLLAYLRYPLIAQPWGWLRALRHVARHRRRLPLRALVRALTESIPLCQQFAPYVRPYSLVEIWRHHRTPVRRWKLNPFQGETSGSISLTVTPAPPAPRVLYVQYTNPGGYPPLQHSAQIFIHHGWEAEFCGLRGLEGTTLELPRHPRISVRRMASSRPGLKQKLHYLIFTLWTVWRAWRFRPNWLYCSDAYSCAPGLLIHRLTGRQVIYHEHDTPAPPSRFKDRLFAHFVANDRLGLGRIASVVVLPNQQRLQAFIDAVGPKGKALCVWNCPTLDEIPPAMPSRPCSQPLTILYHGSIVPDRFPVTNLEAIAKCGRDIRLRLIGYETRGSEGYTKILKAEASRLGVADKFEYLGTLPQRSDLMERCRECDVGLSMLRIHDGDINMRHMAGASNKPFDYLSQGLALVVPDDAEWKRFYVEIGCAMICEPGNAKALADLLVWMDDHRDEVREMGRKGQQLIRGEWNYEAQFQPVLDAMESTMASLAAPRIA